MTAGERQNFQWRPNDNSATTRLRYDLEAQHWVNSIDTALKTKSTGSTFHGLGLVLGIILNILSLLFWGIASIVRWDSNERRKSKMRKETRFVPLTDDEFESRINSGRMKVVDLYED